MNYKDVIASACLEVDKAENETQSGGSRGGVAGELQIGLEFSVRSGNFGFSSLRGGVIIGVVGRRETARSSLLLLGSGGLLLVLVGVGLDLK